MLNFLGNVSRVVKVAAAALLPSRLFSTGRFTLYFWALIYIGIRSRVDIVD